MQESIHGHNVLNLIREYNQPVSKEEILTAIAQHFGSNNLFHTCSAEGLNADQLLELFLAKGKLTLQNEQVHFVGCRCKH